MLDLTVKPRSRGIGLAVVISIAATILLTYAAGLNAAAFSFGGTDTKALSATVTNCIPAPPGLVGWWPGNGNAADLVGGNNGSLINGATFGPGTAGQAFSLNPATGSYVELPGQASSLLNNSAGTIAAWIYPTAVGDNDMVAVFGSGSDGEGVGIGVYGNVRIYHHTATYDWQSNTPISANTWTFIVFTWDNETERIYKDGVLSESRPRNFNYVPGAARIGHGFWNDQANLFPGLIDEVAIFNRTLDAAEVDSLYSAGGSGICPRCEPQPAGMISWWRGENDAFDNFGLNAGSLRNGAAFADGKVGRGFIFNGTDQHIEIPDSPSLRPTDGLTLDGWFRFDTANPQAALISKPFLSGASNAYVVWMQAGALNAGIIGGVLSYPFDPTVGQWYHIAYTYDETTTQHQLYIDGNVVATIIANSDPVYDGSSVLIGMDKDNGAPVLGLTGMADEVTISGRAMTPSEVQAIFNAGSDGRCGAACAQALPGIVAWWPGEGTGNDIQGPTYENGVLLNGATFAPGLVGQAFVFDGVDDQVSVADAPALRFGTNDVTVEAWFKAPPGSTFRAIVGKESQDFPHQAMLLRLDNQGKMQFVVTDCGTGACGYSEPGAGGSRQPVVSPQRVDDNTFHHVAGVRRSTGYELYIDGELVAVRTEEARDSDSSAPLFIGHQFAGGVAFTGIIDETRIFNRAVSQSEIRSIVDARSEGLCHVCTEPKVGTVSWWKAENDADDAFGTNNGTLTNGATFAQGKVGTAFSLDGVDDTVRIADAPNLNFSSNDPVTIHMWAYPTATGLMHMIGKRSSCFDTGESANYQIAQDSNGLHFNSGGIRADSGIQLATGQWHHIAATADGQTFRLYLNGQEVGVTAGSLGAFNNGAPVVVGGVCSNAGATFPGRLDEVTILNRVLVPSEISAIHNAGSAGVCAPTSNCAAVPDGLTSWWRAQNTPLDNKKRNHGALHDGATFSAGLAGKAFALDGLDDYVSVPAFDMGSNWTIEGWINPAACSDGLHCPLVSRSNGNFDGMLLSYLGPGHANQREYSLVIGDGSVWQVQLLSGTKYPTNAWYHVAATRNGDTYALYVDGFKMAEQTVTGVSDQYQSRDFAIGRWTYPTNTFTAGSIDEVSIFRRTLSEAEFSNEYAAAVTGLGKCAAGVTPSDFDGDLSTDLTIYRPVGGSGSEWWTLRSTTGGNWAATFGTPADKIVAEDFTGDGVTDVAIYRPSENSWYVLRSEDYSYYSFPFGTDGDIPVPADYDGDGIADPAVYRPSTGIWYVAKSTGGLIQERFGFPTDKPVPADYDGDGRIDIAIYRPSNGQWWLNRTHDGLIVFTFGNDSDKNVPGDFTGDGKADVAIYRPSEGNWYVLRSEDYTYYSFPFGLSDDIPAAGDFDGDGVFDGAVFRPSDGKWYLRRSSAGFTVIPFGANGDIPVPGAFIR